MKRYSNPRGTALFVIIAVVLMTFSHLFFYDGLQYLKGGDVDQALVSDDVEVGGLVLFDDLPQPDARVNLGALHDHPLADEYNVAGINPEHEHAHGPDIGSEEDLRAKAFLAEKEAKRNQQKKKHRYSLKNPNPDSPARIAIMIDDMGVNRRLSKAMVEFDSVPLTLAFLPYAENLSVLTKPAQANGHELMIHMPMEPMNSKIDTGPIALKSHMKRAEVDSMLDKAFASFDGYRGLNNHMGSRLTQDSERMEWVMEALAKRDLFYVDSKTIQSSIAADKAQEAGLDYAIRDVFLDHEDTPEFVSGALQKLERVALERGHAIAIGHPKAVTLAGLRAWVPTLEARGFEIVPVSELLLTADAPQAVAVKVDLKAEAKKVRETIETIEPAAAAAPLEEVIDWKTVPAYSESLLSAPLTTPEEALPAFDAKAPVSGLYQLPPPQQQ